MNPNVLIVLTLANISAFITRYSVNAVEPVLKEQFSLSNADSGLLISAFVIGYIVGSPLFGYLGDRISRPRLMALGVLCWAVATCLSAAFATFFGFFAARIFVGLGEAVFCTLAPVYLKDVVKDPLRLTRSFGFFYAAIPVGAALGFAVVGSITKFWSWPTAFYCVAALSLPFVFVISRWTEARADATKHRSEPILDGLMQIASRPLVCYAVAGYILQAFALNGVAAFLIRHGTNLGFSYEAINNYFGIILLIAGLIGTLLGGTISTKLASKSDDPLSSMLRFVGVVTLIGTPALALALLTESQELFLGLCFVAELFLFAAVAPVNTVIVSGAPAHLQSLTQGLAILLLNLFGTMLAPWLIGFVADGLAPIEEGRALALALQLASVAMFGAGLVWLTGGYARR